MILPVWRQQRVIREIQRSGGRVVTENGGTEWLANSDFDDQDVDAIPDDKIQSGQMILLATLIRVAAGIVTKH